MFHSSSELEIENGELGKLEKLEKLEKLNRLNWKAQINFEAYGTRIGVRSNCAETIENLQKIMPTILPSGWKEIENSATDYIFSLIRQKNKTKKDVFYKNGELLLEGFSLEENWRFVKSQIQVTVAEFAADYVFLHAGVVGWKGKAIIIPGKSFAGKTTLVAEFVKRGADYYSDDFTVIDKDGYVHPFPKQLSIRGTIDNGQQADFEVEELGGRRGIEPIPVGVLLLTKYKSNVKLNPKLGSIGQGVMAGVANSLSVRQNPKFVLSVLCKIAKDAIIFKSDRNEAKEFVDFFLKMLDDRDLEI